MSPVWLLVAFLLGVPFGIAWANASRARCNGRCLLGRIPGVPPIADPACPVHGHLTDGADLEIAPEEA